MALKKGLEEKEKLRRLLTFASRASVGSWLEIPLRGGVAKVSTEKVAKRRGEAVRSVILSSKCIVGCNSSEGMPLIYGHLEVVIE